MLPIADSDAWSGRVHQTLSLYSEPLLRKVAGKLIRPRTNQPVEELLEKSVGTVSNPPVIDRRIKDLSVAARTVVAIARCLGNNETGQVMVLDEPTAALPEVDVKRLFAAFRRAVAQGHSIVYISHRLEEIFEIADRITVLRDGKAISTVTTAETTQNELVGLMIGRTVDAFYPDVVESAQDEVVLKVQGLNGNVVKDVSVSIRRGEIVGVAGLLGSGKSELGRLIFGAQRAKSGTIAVNGHESTIKGPADAIRAGIAMVPANRHRDAVILNESVLENLSLLDLADLRRFGRVKERPRRSLTDRLLEKFEVRPRDPDRPIAALSGGNQQKVVLAKWIHRKPSVLILDEPAQGIDIGAKIQVFRLLEEAAQEGMALVIISEEFEDLAHMCDRVLVMRNGRVTAELTGSGKTRDQIVAAVYRKASVA